ncbi:MAG: PQQ-binding-like beta-propeller repeat protein [Verrucomicrobia bacterium]|nr:PQQ-binding-like beta-propeller repeat protein [Verrucomicrobiota bacterium]
MEHNTSCRHHVLLKLTVLLIGAHLALAAELESWPQFRGGCGGVADGAKLPGVWSATTNVAWKTAISGKAWSSPVVWGDKVFVTSAVSGRDVEPPRKGLYVWRFWGTRESDEYRCVLYCFDFTTGKVLWERVAHRGPTLGAIHMKNSYASETPATDGEHVFACFGNVGLFCYDMNGREVWSQKWGFFPTRLGWGPAASPVLHGDRVYVVNDNEKASFLAAFDKRTGKQLWRIQRDEPSNWATPLVWENELRTEIVTPGRGKVRSYDLDGHLLWELSGMSDIVIPTPVASRGLLYVSSGYVSNSLRPVYAIRPGASGDISLKDDQTSNEFIAWCDRKAGPYNTSPLLYGDYLYVLYDKGFLACYDAKTGKPVYGRQRLSVSATAFTASPWACDGKIFCLSEDGETFVVQAGSEFKLLGSNHLDEMTLATPAVARDSLVIRTFSKLWRIQNRAEASAR